ncbi:MAG: hypothetical protein ACT4QF_20715 [Sporichthyaceae bacterium]
MHKLAAFLTTAGLALALSACGAGADIVDSGAKASGISATVSSAPTPTVDPAAPLFLTGKKGLTPAELDYGVACVVWGTYKQGVSGTVANLAALAASSKHPGLVAAVDKIVQAPASGRMEMDRMCQNASPS